MQTFTAHINTLQNPAQNFQQKKEKKGKKEYPPLTATVIHATELEQPQDRDRIKWKLVTDLDVDGLEDAIGMLRWYAPRWKIEVFHKILKSTKWCQTCPKATNTPLGFWGRSRTTSLKLTRLGGYLARSNDPHPANIVVWRGMSRLTDICLGLELAEDVGN